MFNKMRLQLTATFTVVTACILIAMAVTALYFSIGQLEKQSRESFRSNVNTVLFYLQTQEVVDQTWLNQTETDNDLWIRIESETARLQYTVQNQERDALTALALESAKTGIASVNDLSPTAVSDTDLSFFTLETENGNYYASISKVPYSSGALTVTILKSKNADRLLSSQLKAGFTLLGLVSLVLLAVFSWLFSGRTIKPVAASHQKHTEFIAAASHELRSPLSVIKLCAGTIKKNPETAFELAGKIEKESSRMARLVSDLLMLAGSDKKELLLDTSLVSPKTLLLNSMERYENLAAEKNITMKLKLPQLSPFPHPQPSQISQTSLLHPLKLPDVLCDRQLVEQVISILLDNAVQFAPEGGEIHLNAYEQRQYICLSVADNGPGIPDIEKPRVFDRFYRGDQSRTDKSHYGLGLSIAWEITALHKGRIIVEDSDIGGANFILFLPKSKSTGKTNTP